MNLDRVIAVRNNKTIYRDGNRCIKVFFPSFSKADVLNEAFNQARIEDTELNIPRVLEVAMIDGKWAIVSDYIKGTTLAALMEKHPEKQDEYLDLLIDLQMRMHAQVCTSLIKLKDRLNQQISLANMSATMRFELHNRLEEIPHRRNLCHGDFTPANVIIREADGVPFILDWAHASQGNASADAAQTYIKLILNDQQTLAQNYLNRFCEKNNISDHHIKKWFPIIAAAQSVEGNKRERTFLDTWINAVDYE